MLLLTGKWMKSFDIYPDSVVKDTVTCKLCRAKAGHVENIKLTL